MPRTRLRAPTTPRRLPYLDDLKVGLVAAIIAGHAVIGYTTGDWTYQ